MSICESMTNAATTKGIANSGGGPSTESISPSYPSSHLLAEAPTSDSQLFLEQSEQTTSSHYSIPSSCKRLKLSDDTLHMINQHRQQHEQQSENNNNISNNNNDCHNFSSNHDKITTTHQQQQLSLNGSISSNVNSPLDKLEEHQDEDDADEDDVDDEEDDGDEEEDEEEEPPPPPPLQPSQPQPVDKNNSNIDFKHATTTTIKPILNDHDLKQLDSQSQQKSDTSPQEAQPQQPSDEDDEEIVDEEDEDEDDEDDEDEDDDDEEEDDEEEEEEEEDGQQEQELNLNQHLGQNEQVGADMNGVIDHSSKYTLNINNNIIYDHHHHQQPHLNHHHHHHHHHNHHNHHHQNHLDHSNHNPMPLQSQNHQQQQIQQDAQHDQTNLNQQHTHMDNTNSSTIEATMNSHDNNLKQNTNNLNNNSHHHHNQQQQQNSNWELFHKSINKLRRSQSGAEPNLLRSVLICNLLRKLERDMDEDGIKINYGPDGVPTIVNSNQEITMLDPPPTSMATGNQIPVAQPHAPTIPICAGPSGEEDHSNLLVDSAAATSNASTNEDSHLPIENECVKHFLDLDMLSSGRVTPFPSIPIKCSNDGTDEPSNDNIDTLIRAQSASPPRSPTPTPDDDCGVQDSFSITTLSSDGNSSTDAVSISDHHNTMTSVSSYLSLDSGLESNIIQATSSSVTSMDSHTTTILDVSSSTVKSLDQSKSASTISSSNNVASPASYALLYTNQNGEESFADLDWSLYDFDLLMSNEYVGSSHASSSSSSSASSTSSNASITQWSMTLPSSSSSLTPSSPLPSTLDVVAQTPIPHLTTTTAQIFYG